MPNYFSARERQLSLLNRITTLEGFALQTPFTDWARPEDFGAVGDGETDDTTAFTLMLASGKKTILPDRLKTYVVTAALTLPDDLSIDGDISILVKATAPTVTTPLITLGKRLNVIGKLRIAVHSDYQWGRLIQGTTIESLRISNLETVSSVLQDEYSVPDFYIDGVFILNGVSSLLDIGYWRCSNFDIIGRWKEVNNAYIGGLNWTGFRKGLEISSRSVGGRGARNLYIANLFAQGNSPNCTGAPGENAIILQGIENGHIDKSVVKDTGEHGIRVTGDNELNQGTYSLTFGSIQVYRPGACGVKLGVSNIDPQNWINDVQIGSLYVEDAGRNIEGLTGSAYLANNNHFGLFLDQVRRCQVGTYLTRKALNTYNGVHGLKLRNATDVSIGKAVIRDSASDAIRVEDLADEPTQDGIYIDAMVQRYGLAGVGGAALKFFNVGGNILDFKANLHISSGVDGVDASGITGPVNRPLLVTGHYYGLTGTAIIPSADPDVHIDIEAL